MAARVHRREHFLADPLKARVFREVYGIDPRDHVGARATAPWLRPRKPCARTSKRWTSSVATPEDRTARHPLDLHLALAGVLIHNAEAAGHPLDRLLRIGYESKDHASHEGCGSVFDSFGGRPGLGLGGHGPGRPHVEGRLCSPNRRIVSRKPSNLSSQIARHQTADQRTSVRGPCPAWLRDDPVNIAGEFIDPEPEDRSA